MEVWDSDEEPKPCPCAEAEVQDVQQILDKAGTGSSNKKTLRDILNPIAKNPEWHLMASESEEMEHGMPYSFENILLQKYQLR